MEQVPEIVRVGAALFDVVARRRLYVAAVGTAFTASWSGAMLTPYYYVEPPADGVWDFDLVAQKPSDAVMQVELPIQALFEGDAPPWLKGVRVHGRRNAVAIEVWEAFGE